jgi:hypothetical protein
MGCIRHQDIYKFKFMSAADRFCYHCNCYNIASAVRIAGSRSTCSLEICLHDALITDRMLKRTINELIVKLEYENEERRQGAISSVYACRKRTNTMFLSDSYSTAYTSRFELHTYTKCHAHVLAADGSLHCGPARALIQFQQNRMMSPNL